MKKLSLLAEAANHFRPVLAMVREGNEERLVVVLSLDDPTLIKGASTTSLIFLDRFVEMFSTLIERADFHISSWKKHAAERDLHIDDKTFEKWRDMSLLHDDPKKFLFVLVYEKSSNLVKLVMRSGNVEGLEEDEKQKIEDAFLERNNELIVCYPETHYDVIMGKAEGAGVNAFLRDAFSEFNWEQVVWEELIL